MPDAVGVPEEQLGFVRAFTDKEAFYSASDAMPQDAFEYSHMLKGVAANLSIDPLYERHYNISPYVFARCNPIRNTDINGLFEYDVNGEYLSDLGGMRYNFYHLDDKKVRIVDTMTGEENLMKDGSFIRCYVHRSSLTNWFDLTKEFLSESGPRNSLFSDLNGEGNRELFHSLRETFSSYGSYIRALYLLQSSEGQPKGRGKTGYYNTNPLTAGVDMWEQFLGRVNVTWYDLGEDVMFMIFDSKSNKSLFYRTDSILNRERGETGRGFGTTRQTYIWVESKAEIRTKMELYKSLMESLNN